MFKPFVAALSFVALVACSKSPQDVLSDANKALGAENLKSVEYTATGFSYVFGQAPNPDAPWPKFNAKSYTRTINFETPASKQTLVRTQFENPPHGGGNQPIAGEATQTVVVTGASPWASQAEIWITPYGFLKGAAANNATLASQTVDGKQYKVLSYMTQEKYKVNGYINDENLIDKVETWVDNPVLGDTLVEVAYSDYKDFGGLKFPTKIVQKQGGHPVYDLTVTDAKPNVEAQIEAPAPAGSPTVTKTEKVADGVYFITGGSHNSVAIEFTDHIAVIEGPLSEERSLAVIAETKKLIPNKPIKYLINTHHHFDHSGGIRPFVAEGATIVTHEMNKPYYEKTFAMARTLAPDQMSSSGKTAMFETMTDKKVMTDGKRTLELYLIEGNGHNDGIIMGYLPKEKVLVEADVFTPPADPKTAGPNPPSVYTTNLVDNLQRLKLDYQTILPLHGRKTNRAELMKWVGTNRS
jgi:glyoxylase-like metal-dependent hydrolase (beta-lactamase superfamily II)